MADIQEICKKIKSSLIESGLFSNDGDEHGNVWRVSPEPFYISQEDATYFDQLGPHLLKFYVALNQLYFDSVKDRAPRWVSEYMDFGKPSDLIDYSRMKKSKSQMPGIIRPDVIVTENGFSVTELDSVPGGFGLTSQLMNLYSEGGRQIIGNEEGGIPHLFYQMVSALSKNPDCVCAIVVSDEAEDYLSEMQFLANILKKDGYSVHAVPPDGVIFREEGLFLNDGENDIQIDVVYRFYELFDLKNIPKSELFMFSSKKGRVKTTPPYKHYLEEKLSFALFHHASLTSWWKNTLGAETFSLLLHLIPKTWVLDNRVLPPHAVIPDLMLKGNAVRDWKELIAISQKEREMVIKTSGFSPESWGSRGVTIGHDVSGEEWGQTLENSLKDFPHNPSILQEFHKGKQVQVTYFDFESASEIKMDSRVRLTPYYFVINQKTQLGGILATLCPHNKKKIHGMVDAIMVPCAIKK
ncbi:MAG: hypothetical protein ACQ9MH_12740 [Nitrospinales bacterium]